VLPIFVNKPRVEHRLCLAGLLAFWAPACSFPSVEFGVLGAPAALASQAEGGSQDLEGGPLDAVGEGLSVDMDSVLADATLDGATYPDVSLVPDAPPVAPDAMSTSFGAVDCGSCPGDATCVNDVCACTPDDAVKTCASLECGQATNNCGQKVNCGVGGTAACPQGKVCTQAGACCVPTDPCTGRCGGIMVTTNCGQVTQCSTACTNGQECTSTLSCCTPNGSCSGACLDSCGEQDSTCCPALPPDAGVPDGGPACAANGAGCTTAAACCSGACAPDTSKMGKPNGMCAASCIPPAGSCTLDAQCCFPLVCHLGGPGRAAACQ
jgi:hypothetical protein